MHAAATHAMRLECIVMQGAPTCPAAAVAAVVLQSIIPCVTQQPNVITTHTAQHAKQLLQEQQHS
jgi:hypothetical protein